MFPEFRFVLILVALCLTSSPEVDYDQGIEAISLPTRQDLTMNASNLESFLAACNWVLALGDSQLPYMFDKKNIYLDGAYSRECDLAGDCEMAARNGDKAGLAKAAEILRAFAPTAAR